MGKPTETADLSQRELTDSRLTTGEPAESTELGPLNVGGSCVVLAIGGVNGSLRCQIGSLRCQIGKVMSIYRAHVFFCCGGKDMSLWDTWFYCCLQVDPHN